MRFGSILAALPGAKHLQVLSPQRQGEMFCSMLHSIVKMCFKATWEFIEMSCWSGRHLLALVRGGLYCLCCWLVERNILPLRRGSFSTVGGFDFLMYDKLETICV